VAAALAKRLEGQAEAASASLKALLSSQPELAKGWYELARTQFYLLQLDAARESIDRALQLEAGNARFHHLAATLAAYQAVLSAKSAATRDQGEPAMRRWIEELEQVLKLQPDNHHATVELVNAYCRVPASAGGDRAKAETLIAQLQTASPVDAAAARALAQEDAKAEETLATWQTVATQRPQDAGAAAALAQAMLHAGQLQGASEQIQHTLELDPQRTRLLLDLARTAAMRGDHTRATTAVRQYLAAEPTPPAPLRAFATFYLAAIERRQQHADEADKLLQQARAIDAHVWTTFMAPPEILFEPL
jgi:tetratricopeptide (TPR) repeat protein